MSLSSKIFIPPYLAKTPLFDHLSLVIDHALRDDMFQFKSEGDLDQIISTFFGENLSENQLESVLMYYKVYVEPYLGTADAIDKLFKILQLDAKVVTWYENKVPLPSYKFNLEFSTLPESIDYKGLIDLIYLVKNERSHLGSIRTEGSPDVFVWDYSYWDEYCWDSPYGATVDGVIFNIIKQIEKQYVTDLSILTQKHIEHNKGKEIYFQSNGSFNDDFYANVDLNPYQHPKFNLQEFSISDFPIHFETQLIGDLNEDLLEYSTALNRISFARQIDQNYASHIISHIDAYSSFKKDDANKIISIKNKTQSAFYVSALDSKYISLDKITRLKNESTFNLNLVELEFPNLSNQLQDGFSSLIIFKAHNISSTPKRLLKIKNNSFSIEISSVSIRIIKNSIINSYSVSLGNLNWNYLYFDSNSLKINGQTITHNLNLKINDQILIGSSVLNMNFNNIFLMNRSLTSTELNSLVTSNM